jgi:GTP-binding protein LepA
MELKNIRNFCIIAHIDHGKSTLADRFLEVTGTIEKRKMKEQVLDSMELERERGITIKMQPVRMNYTLNATPFTLNLIDTPGHIDFYYEVSRALKAVEGAILLVDATQGVQAQTLSTLEMAKEAGLVIIPVVSKIDSPLARIPETKKEIAVLLNCKEDEIMEVSGRTGEGVNELLNEVVNKVPPPKETLIDADIKTRINADTESVSIRDSSNPRLSAPFRGLIFDFQYSNHTGVIVHLRVFDGEVSKKDKLVFKIAGREFNPIEVGVFAPELVSKETLSAGEIGYIVTGIKEPGIASVGDTVALAKSPALALPGYMTPKAVIWASVYPESQDDFDLLRQALLRLRLSDSSFTHEEESSGLLGRGFRCGFLGMLHMEIITERLRREFKLELVVTAPSITYEILDKKGTKTMVYSAVHFPDYGNYEKVFEPWVEMKIITPSDYLGKIVTLLYDYEAEVGESESFGNNRTAVNLKMPLRELMRNFFDDLKSASSGFASMSYKIKEMREADVVKLEILVADEVISAFSRVVGRRKVEIEAEKTVEKLYNIMPRQQFSTKIQGKALGRIISSKTLSALRKDVTGYLYGGDVTRKMKLLEKQKKGKKRMKERGRGNVNIPQEVFLKMMRQNAD